MRQVWYWGAAAFVVMVVFATSFLGELDSLGIILGTSSKPMKPSFQKFVEKHDGRAAAANYTQVYDRLLEKHPDFFFFGQEGRDMMDALIKELAQRQDYVTILEIGVWLGYSSSRWANLADNVRVVGVDPFLAPNNDHYKLQSASKEDRENFGQPWFNKGMAHFLIDKLAPNSTDRVVLVTGYYPDAAKDILNHVDNIEVDILYLDGGKTSNAEEHCQFVNETLTEALKAFPNMILSGDDYNHVPYENLEQFQRTIKDLSRHFHRPLYTARKRTWIMADGLSDRVTKHGERIKLRKEK